MNRSLSRTGPRMGQSLAATSFWPSMLDLVTSTLMVFVLVGFVETVLDAEDLEALLTRQEQSQFIEQFGREFETELASGEVGIEPHLNFLQITFSDGVLFESTEYRLKPQGRQLLGRCAKVFSRASASGYEQIQVEGHTDSRVLRRQVYPRNNWELSTARALSVVRFLTEQGGLPAAVFSANGYAEHRPVAGNQTDKGRARNRRVEIRLFFSVGKQELPQPKVDTDR